MSGYELRTTTSAAKSLGKLPRVEQKLISDSIKSLPDNPRPHGVAKLSGPPHSYRIRVGNYHVYTIDDGELVIVVVRIGHRREVYTRRAIPSARRRPSCPS